MAASLRCRVPTRRAIRRRAATGRCSRWLRSFPSRAHSSASGARSSGRSSAGRPCPRSSPCPAANDSRASGGPRPQRSTRRRGARRPRVGARCVGDRVERPRRRVPPAPEGHRSCRAGRGVAHRSASGATSSSGSSNETCNRASAACSVDLTVPSAQPIAAATSSRDRSSPYRSTTAIRCRGGSDATIDATCCRSTTTSATSRARPSVAATTDRSRRRRAHRIAVTYTHPAGRSIAEIRRHRTYTRVNASCAASSAHDESPSAAVRPRHTEAYCSSKNAANDEPRSSTCPSKPRATEKVQRPTRPAPAFDPSRTHPAVGAGSGLDARSQSKP